MAVPQIYTPLQTVQNEIRILALLPSPPLSTIRCTLEIVSLDSRPRYEALSYVWGDASVRNEILVDGLPLLITQNLFVALNHFRHVEEELRIWIDAICVNQDDLIERGQQVSLMRRVYSQAFSTKVWLGPADEDSDKALSLIHLVSDVYDDCRERSTAQGKDVIDIYQWGHLRSWSVKEELAALGRLFRRPWWYRVWIVQEVAASCDVVMHCGQSTCVWTQIRQALNILYRGQHWDDIPVIVPYEDFKHIHNGLRRIHFIEDVRVSFRGREDYLGRSLLYMLVVQRDAFATDPRDKFIASSGLISRKAISEMSMDTSQLYTQSLTICYARACEVLAHLDPGSPLNFLEFAGRSSASTILSSWIPDWSCTVSSSLGFWNTFLAYKQHTRSPKRNHEVKRSQAFGPECSNMPPRYGLIEDRHVLNTFGVVVDSVGDISLFSSISNNAGTTGLIKHPKELSSNSSPELFRATHDLWQTLRGDWIHFPLPEHWIHAFYSSFVHFENPMSWRIGISNPNFRIRDYTLAAIVREHISTCAVCPIKQTSNSNWTKTGGLIFNDSQIQNPIFTTRDGHLGISHQGVHRGDTIAILFGCDLPVILRKRNDNYEFVSMCYIHSLMSDGAIAALDTSKLKLQDFRIF